MMIRQGNQEFEPFSKKTWISVGIRKLAIGSKTWFVKKDENIKKPDVLDYVIRSYTRRVLSGLRAESAEPFPESDLTFRRFPS